MTISSTPQNRFLTNHLDSTGIIVRRTNKTVKDILPNVLRQRDIERKLQYGELTPDEYNDELSTLQTEQSRPAEETSMLEEIGAFDSLRVWDHDAAPDEFENPYIKGVMEWLNLARRVSPFCLMWVKLHSGILN